MLDWIKRLFRLRSNEEKLQNFFGLVDEANRRIGGGDPVLIEQEFGRILIPSRTLCLNDPGSGGGAVAIEGFACDELIISGKLRSYPSGSETIMEVQFDDPGTPESDGSRVVGDLLIDSARMIAVDQEFLNKFWANEDLERIGHLGIMADDKLVRQLEKRFKLRFDGKNATQAVSKELEQQIKSYLETVCENKMLTFMKFYVWTNNSFDRIMGMKEEWGFLPVGNDPQPLLFLCVTGRGDGSYPVMCEFAGETPVSVRICFIPDQEG